MRRGFSLIELLLVVVIAGVLLTVSGTAISRQISRDRVLRSANVAEGLLAEASQLAVRRGTPVRINVSGTALQLTDRNAGTILKQRNFGPGYDLRATLTASPDTGVVIFPNGRADGPIRIVVSGSGLSTTISRTATGIVRRQ